MPTLALPINITESAEIKEFTVSELSSVIKGLLESNLSYIRVKGEISNFKVAASGHGYFNLKDNAAILCCTCWRPVLSKVDFTPNDGLEVVIAGKLTAYAGQSRYQLTVENIKPAGLGAMMQILNERKDRLSKEGLFDNVHKKPLPFLPKKIGVITSISGAVIKDIIHRITDRCPSSILIWPVTVQGSGAAEEVANAIEGFNKLDIAEKPDVIIVARGGGSIEDLWCFNEEIVVRAAFASYIPLISAIGHETDFTLLDFVADLRAPTPTAAAEFAVPVRDNISYTINSHYNYLQHKLLQIIRHYWQIIGNFENILKSPGIYINHLQQRIDELEFRLSNSLPNLLVHKINSLSHYKIDLALSDKITNLRNLKLNYLKSHLNNAANNLLKNFDYKLQLNSQILNSLDYKNVLRRGFAIIEDEQGKVISSASRLKNIDKFIVSMQDDKIIAKKI